MKGTVRQRGKSWTWQINLGPDPDTGKRRFETKGGFGLRRQAQAALDSRLGELGVLDPRYRSSDESMGSLIEAWMAQKHSLSVTIRADYRAGGVRRRRRFEWTFERKHPNPTVCLLVGTSFVDKSGDDAVDWLWEFPDGEFYNVQNPSMYGDPAGS